FRVCLSLFCVGGWCVDGGRYFTNSVFPLFGWLIGSEISAADWKPMSLNSSLSLCLGRPTKMQAAMRGMFPALKPNYSSATSQFFLFSKRHFSSKLFIRGLPFSMTDQMLADAFSEFGKVVKAEVIKDKDKKKSKGFGYVTFDSEDEAQKALRSTHGKPMHGRVVFVDKQE
ncbi:unnamed protein product, partial [Linum tenue]